MKAIKMMLAAMLLCFTATVSAQYVNIRYKDGSQQIIRQSDIKKMYVNRKASGTTLVHEYVDLGLTTKWASCNIGADAPEDTGLFFAWGELEGLPDITDDRMFYDFTEYTRHSNGEENGMGLTKYNWYDGYGADGFVDNKMILDPEDDAATMLWGDKWRMPTQADFDELQKYCRWKIVDRNGIMGWEVTSKIDGFTDKSLFFPLTGYLWAGLETEETMYWTSNLSDEDPTEAMVMWMNDEQFELSTMWRCFGVVIRPVRK